MKRRHEGGCLLCNALRACCMTQGLLGVVMYNESSLPDFGTPDKYEEHHTDNDIAQMKHSTFQKEREDSDGLMEHIKVCKEHTEDLSCKDPSP